MTTQPEVLELADTIELGGGTRSEQYKAAVELRRLHEVNQELVRALTLVLCWVDNWDPEFTNDPDWQNCDNDIVRSALTKAEKKE